MPKLYFSTLAVVAALAFSVTALPVAAASDPACSPTAPLEVRLSAALSKTDRPSDQRTKDESRLSETRFLLTYVKPGDHILDLGSGGGYAAMIMSAAVCDGTVDSQNPKTWDVDFKAGAARQALAAKRPNVHLLQTDFDKVPVPDRLYDLIFIGTIYHDTFNEADHDALRMDRALFAALKPGGLVVLTDHKATDGAGVSTTNTLHRIEKATVLADFKAAGFLLMDDSKALSNSTDDHSLNVFDPKIRGKTDRMALVFRKPS